MRYREIYTDILTDPVRQKSKEREIKRRATEEFLTIYKKVGVYQP